MNHRWMKADRLSLVYEKECLEFLEYEKRNLPDKNGISYCPYVICKDIKKNQGKKYSITYIVMEFVKIIQCEDDMVKQKKKQTVASQRPKVDIDMNDQLEDMIHDIGESAFKKAYIYDTLYIDNDAPLYKGCTRFTQFSAVLKLINIKEKVGWTDKSFT